MAVFCSDSNKTRLPGKISTNTGVKGGLTMTYEKPDTFGEEELERLAGKFADSDNHTPDFAEELSDGGERNKMAEAQRERLKKD